jgi:hypothetical protein
VKILKEYEIKVSNYKVYFRADYTNISRESWRVLAYRNKN